MAQAKYRGWIIEVKTFELPNNSGWRSLVNIECHDSEGVTASPTDPIPVIFKSEEEANGAGVNRGKELVDARYVSNDDDKSRLARP
jgi:hypothetical protein